MLFAAGQPGARRGGPHEHDSKSRHAVARIELRSLSELSEQTLDVGIVGIDLPTWRRRHCVLLGQIAGDRVE